MARKSNLPESLRRLGGPGRPKGVPNHVTPEIKELARRMLTDPEYLQALKVRLKRGSAQAVEVQLYQFAYGKPKETIDMNVSDYRKMPTDELVERARELAARLDGTTHAKRVLEDA